MIEYEASSGYTGLAPREIYRINRIRIAKELHIDPRIVDEWDMQTYYDFMDVNGADNDLLKLKK